jgi:HD superfamily phosphodiesterase
MERYYIRLQSKKEDYNFRNALKLKQMTNTITEFAEFNHEFAEQVIEELNYRND